MHLNLPARCRYALLLLLLNPLSCGKPQATGEDTIDPPAPTIIVTDDRTDLLFSWFEDGNAHAASRIEDIPESARSAVRVQDPAIPPERRDPARVFMVDLTRRNDRGEYPVSRLHRKDYEALRRPTRTPDTEPAEAPSSTTASNVILYVTPHCTHCRKARKWLLAQQIPYTEIDLSQNTDAAARLAQQGAAQGIPTDGVPIFDVNGRLIPGFSPPDILRMLQSAPSPAETQTHI